MDWTNLSLTGYIEIPRWAYWCALVYLLIGQTYLSAKIGFMLRNKRLLGVKFRGNPENNASPYKNKNNSEPISPVVSGETTHKPNNCGSPQPPS